jgi:hypothetical protein
VHTPSGSTTGTYALTSAAWLPEFHCADVTVTDDVASAAPGAGLAGGGAAGVLGAAGDGGPTSGAALDDGTVEAPVDVGAGELDAVPVLAGCAVPPAVHAVHSSTAVAIATT